MDKKILAITVIAIIAIAFLYLNMPKESTKYVCSDGRIVFNNSECITTTFETFIATTEPEETVETTVETSTRATSRATSTTFACISSLDCGKGNVNGTPYCKDYYVKIDEMKPACTSPGTVKARCGYTPIGVSHILQTCNSLSEFCSQGTCIPRTCVNNKRDIGEEKIDCGGNCLEKCDEFSIMCINDSDCGNGLCSNEYFCLETNIAYNCTERKCVNNGTTSSTCVDIGVTKIKEICKRAVHCEEGRGLCTEGGNCMDCVRNQDEVKIDCGGESCQPCVVIPENYNTVTISGATSFKADYVDFYGSTYVFTLTKVVMGDNCPTAVKIRLDRGDKVIASGEIDRYSSVMLHKFEVGLVEIESTSSATIWIHEPEM